VVKNYNFCTLNKDERPFFTLVDYRNNYFTSNDPDKIIEFYNGFQNRDELMEWMRERPKGNCLIREVEGDKEIIVVIPTIDAGGKFAKNCEENIFKGLHIIFVESGYNNFYFNYAHNCNVGIRRALEYDPKWIIVSNDDMVKIDDVDKLRMSLLEFDNKVLKTIFTTQSSHHPYHSYKTGIGIKRKFLGNMGMIIYHFIHRRLREYLIKNRVMAPFKVQWTPTPRSEVLSKIFFKKVHRYIMTSDFCILSSKWCLQFDGNVFNETYINGVEDWELSILLTEDEKSYSFIDYKIGDLIGSTLSTDPARTLRDVANVVYFDDNVNEHKLSFRL